MPPAAREYSPRAAAAFAAYFWRSINYAQATGDVRRLRRLSFQCDACDAGLHWIKSVYRTGGEVRGGVFSVAWCRARLSPRYLGDWMEVHCRLTSTRQLVDLKGDRADERYAGGPIDIDLSLEPSHDAWLVREIVDQQ